MLSLSAECATREEAIEAARALHGPDVRILGVRRVRTGGVMGFFSAERFIAEVELPDPAAPATGEDGGPRSRRAAAAQGTGNRAEDRPAWSDLDHGWPDDHVASGRDDVRGTRRESGSRTGSGRPVDPARSPRATRPDPARPDASWAELGHSTPDENARPGSSARGTDLAPRHQVSVDDLADLLAGDDLAPAAGVYSPRTAGGARSTGERVPRQRAATDRVPHRPVADRAPQQRSASESQPRVRAGQDRAPRERALTDRSDRSDRAPHDRAPQDRSSHDRMPQERSPRDRIVHDRTPHDRGTHDRATHDRATHDRATHDRVTQDRAPHDRAVSDRGPVDRHTGSRAADARPAAAADRSARPVGQDSSTQRPTGTTHRAAAREAAERTPHAAVGAPVVRTGSTASRKLPGPATERERATLWTAAPEQARGEAARAATPAPAAVAEPVEEAPLSPFAAALARMVGQDNQVREAVEEASLDLAERPRRAPVSRAGTESPVHGPASATVEEDDLYEDAAPPVAQPRDTAVEPTRPEPAPAAAQVAGPSAGTPPVPTGGATGDERDSTSAVVVGTSSTAHQPAAAPVAEATPAPQPSAPPVTAVVPVAHDLVEPALVHAEPVQAAPAQVAPAQPAPVQAAPEPVPVTPPVHAEPGQAVAPRSEPAQPAAVQAAPEPLIAHAAPLQAEPAQAAPVQAAPVPVAPVPAAPVPAAPVQAPEPGLVQPAPVPAPAVPDALVQPVPAPFVAPPAPVPATPVQPAPDPVLVQPVPAQAAPIQSAPVQSAPVQSAPVQSAPVPPAPVQLAAAPVQATPPSVIRAASEPVAVQGAPEPVVVQAPPAPVDVQAAPLPVVQPAPAALPVAPAPAAPTAAPTAPPVALPNEVATLPIHAEAQPQAAQLVMAAAILGGALPVPVEPSPAPATATAAPETAAAPTAPALVAAPPAVLPNVVTPVLPAVQPSTHAAPAAAHPSPPIAPWSPAPVAPSRRGRHRSVEEEPDEAPLRIEPLGLPDLAPVPSRHLDLPDVAPFPSEHLDLPDLTPVRSRHLGQPATTPLPGRHLDLPDQAPLFSGYLDEPVREPLPSDTCAMPRVRPEVELSPRAASRAAGHLAVRALPPLPSSSWGAMAADTLEPAGRADRSAAPPAVVDAPVRARPLADTTAPREADVPLSTAHTPMTTATPAPGTSTATTASAPWSDDSTASMPPLTLLPPRTARPSWVSKPPALVRRPEPARMAAPALEAVPASRRPAGGSAVRPADRLALVARLMDGRRHDLLCHAAGPADLVPALRALGLPEAMLTDTLAADARARGAYSALYAALDAHLPALPQAPTGAGDVLAVVGPGSEALVAARALAEAHGLDSDQVLWATAGELACLTPPANQMSSVDGARLRRQASASASTVTVVAIDAPLRSGRSTWVSQMLDVWAPTAVWGALDATRKPGDLSQWLRGLPRLDAIAVSGTDASTDPAAVLTYAPVPVALLDGAPATAHRWATLLCERLEGAGT